MGVAEVVLTDSDPVAITNCIWNFDRNEQHLLTTQEEENLTLRIELFDWNSIPSNKNPHPDPGKFDILLGADCIYEDNIEEFTKAIRANLVKPSRDEDKSRTGGIAFVVLRERDGSGNQLYQKAFVACCHQHELHVEVIDQSMDLSNNLDDPLWLPASFDSGPTFVTKKEGVSNESDIAVSPFVLLSVQFATGATKK